MNGSRNPQRPGERSSLDALNRTIEGLEARIEGLMAGSRDPRGQLDGRLSRTEPSRFEQTRADQHRSESARNLPLRDDPVSEIMQRQRALDTGRDRLATRGERRPASADHHVAAQHAHAAYGSRPVSAQPFAAQQPDTSVKEIAQALVSLRQELKKDINDGLEREMQSLRAEIRGIRQMAETRSHGDDLREDLQRLAAGINQLGRQSGQADGLRVEFDELRSVLDGLAREDSVRRMEDRWTGVEQKLSIFDQTRDDELVALAYRLDELKAQIGAISATPALRNLESKIETIAQSIDRIGYRQEPDGNRFASHFDGLDARLDEISRAIAASGRAQQASAVDHTMMQRLEGRIADLAGQLDQMAHRPAPAAEQGLGLRIEALAARMEELANEEAALRLEERIEQLSLLLEQAQQAPVANNDDLTYYLADISRKIDAMDQGAVNEQLAGRLDALARRIDDIDAPSGTPFSDDRFSRIEGRLSAIADRLDATRTAPAGDHEALRGLEAQIAHLSTLISTPSGMPAAGFPSEFESRMATIEDYMATNDEYIVEAARQAAEAVMEAYRHTGSSAGMTSPDMDAIAGLASDLRALEELTRSGEERTARTFDALHETLVQIAGRLEQMDEVHEASAFGRREAAMPRAEIPFTDERHAASEHRPSAMRDNRDDDYPFEDDDFGASAPRGLAAAVAETSARPASLHAAEPASASYEDDMMLAGTALDIGSEAVSTAVPQASEVAGKDAAAKPGLLAGLARRFVPGRREEPVQAERRQIDPTPSIDPVDELAPEEANQLLEPGSGVPDVRRILERVRAGQANGGRGAATSEAEKADFIAAARRAARMAAEETDSISRVALEKKGAKAEKPAAGSAFSRHRRPILMAVGAVLLAIMSYPLVSTLVTGDAAPVVAEQTAATSGEGAVIAAGPVDTVTADSSASAGNGQDAARALAVPETAGGLTDTSPLGTDDGAAVAATDTGAALLTRPADVSPEDATAGFEPVQTPTDDVLADAPLAGEALEGSDAAPLGGQQSAAIIVPAAITPASLSKAAAEGDQLALFEVGARYTEGRGVAMDLSEASRWYGLSAERGFAPAQYRLANLFEKGQGVERDLDRARSLYEEAAQQGNASAMHNLAVLLATGTGNATPDFDAAATWFKKASDFGVRDSQFNLAILYARGNGVTQDLEESYKWFAIAARDGDTDAAQKRDEVANAMRPEQLSSAKAKVELWKAQPLDDKSNATALPDEWAGTGTKTASVDVKKAVRNIQAILNNNGFNAGTPDGQMGKKTVAAIKAFQKSVGQAETGEIDDQLVTELLKRNKQPG